MNYKSAPSTLDFLKVLFFPNNSWNVIPKLPFKFLEPDQAAPHQIENQSAIQEVLVTSPTYYNSELLGDLKSKANLILDTKCKVNGSVVGDQIELSGEIFGDVVANCTLVLKRSAVVHGNVVTKRLFADPGAVVKGNCRVSHLLSQGKNRACDL